MASGVAGGVAGLSGAMLSMCILLSSSLGALLSLKSTCHFGPPQKEAVTLSLGPHRTSLSILNPIVPSQILLRN